VLRAIVWGQYFPPTYDDLPLSRGARRRDTQERRIIVHGFEPEKGLMRTFPLDGATGRETKVLDGVRALDGLQPSRQFLADTGTTVLIRYSDDFMAVQARTTPAAPG
jgi:hypothetical protein